MLLESQLTALHAAHVAENDFEECKKLQLQLDRLVLIKGAQTKIQNGAFTRAGLVINYMTGSQMLALETTRGSTPIPTGSTNTASTLTASKEMKQTQPLLGGSQDSAQSVEVDLLFLCVGNVLENPHKHMHINSMRSGNSSPTSQSTVGVATVGVGVGAEKLDVPTVKKRLKRGSVQLALKTLTSAFQGTSHIGVGTGGVGPQRARTKSEIKAGYVLCVVCAV